MTDDPVAAYARLRRLETVAWWLDNRWAIPGTKWRIGLDGVASLLPVAGDTLTALVSVWLVAEAHQAGAPKRLIGKMLGNVALDWAVGSIPVIGTIFDVAFKANARNMDLLKRHIEERITGP